MKIEYWSLDCDIIGGPKESGVKIATAQMPEIAKDIATAMNLGQIQLNQEELYALLRELVSRIEACGASPELTNAVVLASDIAKAVGNQWNEPSTFAAERVRGILPF